MILNHVKLGGISYIKFAEDSRADDKRAKEEYLRKCLPIRIFISDLSLLNVKNWGDTTRYN